jgi:hypothetical protein
MLLFFVGKLDFLNIKNVYKCISKILSACKVKIDWPFFANNSSKKSNKIVWVIYKILLVH